MNMPINTYRPAALVAALAVMLASPASGADPDRPAMEKGESMPRVVPMSEMRDMDQVDRFGRADSDRDGSLSRSEFQALRQAGDAAAPSGALASLKDKRIRDVQGLAVLNQGGTKIGKLEKLVKGRQDNQLYAVISVGGFLGIGDTELTMPLAEMSWEQGRLIAPTAASKRELKSSQDYDKMAYSEVDRELTVHHAAGLTGQPPLAAFESIDANKDQRIERSEFSAFESGEPQQPSGSGGAMPSRRNTYDKPY